MKREFSAPKVIPFIALCAATFTQLSAAPIIFDAIDPGATAASPRPNSNAAAASFDAAASGSGTLIVNSFESVPIGNFTSLGIGSGVTASLQGTDPAGGIKSTNATIEGFNTTTGGARRLEVRPTFNVGTARLTLTFDQAIQAFGTYITGLGTASGNLFVLFNDGSNQSFPVVGNASGGVKFFGFIDPGASIVQVALEIRNITSSRDIFSIDDLRFVQIPEPPSITLTSFSTMVVFSRPKRRR